MSNKKTTETVPETVPAVPETAIETAPAVSAVERLATANSRLVERVGNVDRLVAVNSETTRIARIVSKAVQQKRLLEKLLNGDYD